MENNITASSVVVTAKEQLSTDLGEEAVILVLASGQYYSLNDVGSRIWDLVQEPTTVLDVRDAIVAEYEVEPDRCEEDLLAILKELSTEGLIEIRDAQDA